MVIDALGQREQLVLAGGRVVITLERRRGTPEYDCAFLDLRAHDRDVACVIAWCFLLFVSRLMFFVDNDEAEILERREDRAASTDYNARPTRVDLVPFIVALAFR